MLPGLLAAMPAGAVESPVQRSQAAAVSLAADVAAVAPGEAFRIGLRMRLAPGWHSYWRNAGDAGAPAEVSLTLPEGTRADPIAWPAPERIEYGPLVNFGYKGEVLLPIAVHVPATAAASAASETAARGDCCTGLSTAPAGIAASRPGRRRRARRRMPP